MTTDELVEKALEIFNGGLVNYNDAANPRGYTTVYRPKAAMLAALTAIQSDLRARHYGEVIIPRELFDFLMGTGEIDGCGFGDLNGLPGRFWWRALLATCDSRGDPTPMEETKT